MFENIIKFFKKTNNKKEEINKDTAKERLHLVLMQDRANVSADFLDMMKQEIIDVIKKYIDVDEKEIDVKLTNKQNSDGTTGAPALYANIPIKSIKNETIKIANKVELEKERQQEKSKQEQAKKEQEKQEQEQASSKQEKNPPENKPKEEKKTTGTKVTSKRGRKKSVEKADNTNSANKVKEQPTIDKKQPENKEEKQETKDNSEKLEEKNEKENN